MRLKSSWQDRFSEMGTPQGYMTMSSLIKLFAKSKRILSIFPIPSDTAPGIIDKETLFLSLHLLGLNT
jgi:hypothetical protein